MGQLINLRAKGQAEPTIYLLKGKSINDDPEVVKKGERDDHRPVIAQPSRRIKNERPVGRSRFESPGSRVARVSSATSLLLLLLCRVSSKKSQKNNTNFQ